MRWGLRRDLVGDTSARDVGVLTVVGGSLKATFWSRFTWGASAFAAASIICWGFDAWIVLPLALLAVLVATLMGGGAWLAVQRSGAGCPIRLPSPAHYADAAAQALVRRLTEARSGLERAVREAPRGSTSDLTEAQATAIEIERRVVVLAARVEYIGGFLSTTAPSEIRSALQRARGREPAGADVPPAEVVGAYEGHLRTLQALERQRETLLATGEYLVSVLEALPAGLTRLQCARLSFDEDSATDAAMRAAADVRERVDGLEEAFQQRASG
jgi:hypothetical protein